VSQVKRVGLIVNPIAGMGGAVGLKGTDGSEALRCARALGAVPRSPDRATTALRVLARERPRLELHASAGLMGEVEARAAGLDCVVTGAATRDGDTTAADTSEAAAEMAGRGVDLLLFAGGDGTARDIMEAIGDVVPVVGIPAGVKIQSGVFAVSPFAAGMLAAEYVAGRASMCSPAEVMDLDEERARTGVVSPRLLGYLTVPEYHTLRQGPKARDVTEREERASIARELVRSMDDSTQYVIGPGTTTGAVMAAIGLPHTLLGVDVIEGGRLVAADVTEAELLELVAEAPLAKVVVSPIGGQGHVFGRGNQQISPRVLAAVGPENVVIVASDTKLSSLRGRPLRLDLDDDEIVAQLTGYRRIVTGEGQTALYPVVGAVDTDIS
jgi:predicted polyphosphate/ATP-dependent NAD kinase